jgi:phosphoglycolate phosphatase
LDYTRLYPGVHEALQQLAGSNGSPRRILAVLTNKPERVSREILAGLGIADLFRFVYGGNTFETKKPDPLGIYNLLQQTRLSAARAIIVGDSDVDMQAGANAGIWRCAVTYGFGALQVESNPPDLVIHNLRELPAALDAPAPAQLTG